MSMALVSGADADANAFAVLADLRSAFQASISAFNAVSVGRVSFNDFT